MLITYIFAKITNTENVDSANMSTSASANKSTSGTSANKNIKDIVTKFSNLEKEIEKLNHTLHRIIEILKINGSVHVLIKDEYLNSKCIIALLKPLCESENLKQDFDYFVYNDKSFIVATKIYKEKAIA